MKNNNVFENIIHSAFLILGLVTVACVLLITVYLVISGIPAILEIGLWEFLFGTIWDPAAAVPQYGILPFILSSIEKLKKYATDNPPNLGDADSVLGLLYECINENNPYDNEQIKVDFRELYQQMNGMPLQEMDRIIYPVSTLCRDHKQAGFIEGIKVGMQLEQELTKEYWNSTVRIYGWC